MLIAKSYIGLVETPFQLIDGDDLVSRIGELSLLEISIISLDLSELSIPEWNKILKMVNSTLYV